MGDFLCFARNSVDVVLPSCWCKVEGEVWVTPELLRVDD